jgi:hypothetical protein
MYRTNIFFSSSYQTTVRYKYNKKKVRLNLNIQLQISGAAAL